MEVPGMLRFARQVRVGPGGNVLANRLQREDERRYEKSPSVVKVATNGDVRLKFYCRKLSEDVERMVVFHLLRRLHPSEQQLLYFIVENKPRLLREEDWIRNSM